MKVSELLGGFQKGFNGSMSLQDPTGGHGGDDGARGDDGGDDDARGGAHDDGTADPNHLNNNNRSYML